MTTKENNNEISPPVSEEQPAKPTEPKARKLLTPEEIQKRKKMLIYPLMVGVFLLAIYLIFAPSKADREKRQVEQGINIEIPQVIGDELLDDKEEAYKKADNEQKEAERQSTMGALSDFFGITQKANNRSEEWELVAEPDYRSGSQSDIQHSATAYRDIQHTLGNFYQDNSGYEAMQQQIIDLQAQLNERNTTEAKDDDVQKQLLLMEKSYEMASRYMPQGNNSNALSFAATNETIVEKSFSDVDEKTERSEPQFSVLAEKKQVVSALYQEVSDSVFIAEQMQERNRRFLSARVNNNETPDKNTLRVSVHETVTLKDGETVRLRLLEPARVANLLIPKNTLLTAFAKIQGNRLTLSVTHIEQQEQIISVNLSAFDLDGQPGVFIPNSEEMNAVKEVVAGMGQSAGTSFTFSASAGQQLASDAGKGVMQGASQYLNKKMREVKVTLKSGHKLFLIQNK